MDEVSTYVRSFRYFVPMVSMLNVVIRWSDCKNIKVKASSDGSHIKHPLTWTFPSLSFCVSVSVYLSHTYNKRKQRPTQWKRVQPLRSLGRVRCKHPYFYKLRGFHNLNLWPPGCNDLTAAPSGYKQVLFIWIINKRVGLGVTVSFSVATWRSFVQAMETTSLLAGLRLCNLSHPRPAVVAEASYIWLPLRIVLPL